MNLNLEVITVNDTGSNLPSNMQELVASQEGHWNLNNKWVFIDPKTLKVYSNKVEINQTVSEEKIPKSIKLPWMCSTNNKEEIRSYLEAKDRHLTELLDQVQQQLDVLDDE